MPFRQNQKNTLHFLSTNFTLIKLSIIPGPSCSKLNEIVSQRLFVLRFYGPVNSFGSYRVWSVYLTTLLLGRLSPLSYKPVLCTFFRQKLTNFLNQLKGENERKKYFIFNLHKITLPTRRRSNPEPPDHQLDTYPPEPPGLAVS